MGWRAPAPTPCLRAARRAMLAVAAGSALLHGTGTAAGQLLDEIPMLLLALRLLECTDKRRPWVQAATAAVAALYAVWGFHALFVSLFFLLTAAAVLRMRRGAGRCGAWILAAFLCWLAEQALCARVPALAWCHVAWHLLSAYAGWLFFAYQARGRA